MLKQYASSVHIVIHIDASRQGATKEKQPSYGTMISLLQQYITVLEDADAGQENTNEREARDQYQMPSDTVSENEWAEFYHVYQIHCPKIFMDSAIRDVRNLRSLRETNLNNIFFL